jgi:hypothetical protein
MLQQVTHPQVALVIAVALNTSQAPGACLQQHSQLQQALHQTLRYSSTCKISFRNCQFFVILHSVPLASCTALTGRWGTRPA